jgi:two-component system sensor histidine kinase YesM
MRGSAMYEKYNPKDEEWFKKSIANFGKPVAISTFTLPYVADMKNKPVYVFSLSRGLVQIESSSVVGVIMVNSNLNFISDLCNEMLIVPNQRIIIIDGIGRVVYDTIGENIAGALESGFLELVASTTDKAKNIRIDNIDFLVSCKD